MLKGSDSGDVQIVQAAGEQIDLVKSLWREYWDLLGLASDFQNFAEELDGLPGAYAPPEGCLLLALVDNQAAGTAALRPLKDSACEAKRLFVRPNYRRKGIGKSLLYRLANEARAAGYKDMYGDTLPSMSSALEMYREMGFVEVGPYSAKPTEGAIFLKLSLSGPNRLS